MTTLFQYVTETRRLLHDANRVYWDDPELTDYINDARRNVVRDTGCLRSLQTVTLTAGQETYPFSVLPNVTDTIDVLNLTVIWGDTRIPLRYMPFTEFNARMRVWTTRRNRPEVFTVYGQNTVYVGPVPDQTYVSEWDTVVMPPDLVLGSDIDTIPYPFPNPVAFFAASKAKYKEQSYEDADRFEVQYKKKVLEALRSTATRRIPNVYGMP